LDSLVLIHVKFRKKETKVTFYDFCFALIQNIVNSNDFIAIFNTIHKIDDNTPPREEVCKSINLKNG
jgi:hypothetical protein